MTTYLSSKETKFLIKNIPTKKTLCSGAWSKFYQIQKKQYQSYLNLFRKLTRERLFNPIYKVNIIPTLKSEKDITWKLQTNIPHEHGHKNAYQNINKSISATYKSLLHLQHVVHKTCENQSNWGFPGVLVVKNLPANVGTAGLIRDLRRSHLQGSNKALVPQLFSLYS